MSKCNLTNEEISVAKLLASNGFTINNLLTLDLVDASSRLLAIQDYLESSKDEEQGLEHFYNFVRKTIYG